MKRKICVITGSRSEYGLMFWLMKEIQEDPSLTLQIIVTGSHLSPEFGLTYKAIEKERFHIDAKVEMLLSSDTPIGVAKSMGLAVIGFADAINNLQPDIIVLMGDRYEILAASQVAMVENIPIAHISGGEITEGAIDEAIRHSITKMSHLHFVAAETYRKRVIQLGENPENIFNFGEPGLDNIQKLKLLNREEFENSIDSQLWECNFLVTYHPVTLSSQTPDMCMNALFNALDAFPKAKIIFTKPNADTNGRRIIQMIDSYMMEQPDRVKVFTSLGQLRYLSAIKFIDVVIGNSSSGLVEVPAMKKPTVNIGNRQKGRLKAESVIDCEETTDAIIMAIQKALSPEFQKSLSRVISLYGEGNTSPRIKNVLKTVNLDGMLQKPFFDIIT